MTSNRRDFLRLAGSVTGSAALAACSAAALEAPAPDATNLAAGSGGAGSSSTPSPSPQTPSSSASTNPNVVSLRNYLQAHATPIYSLPPAPVTVPSISWAGALSNAVAPSSLPGGVVIPLRNPLVNLPIASQYSASLPGNPMVGGLPCLAVNRAYTCKGVARTVGSVHVLRIKTDAPVLELSGVVADGSRTVQTLIVDGHLAAPKALSSARVPGGGWDVGTVQINFGSRQLREIWIDTGMYVAYVKVDAAASVVAIDDSAEPQMTVVGDSYMQANSATFGNGGAIALETAARLGIKKVATDAIGGTGYWNSGLGWGNLNDRLAAHAADNSTIYLVVAGINDYADAVSISQLSWPTRAVYEQAVLGYLQGLRSRQPNALIVVTAPFCPNANMSDSSYIAQPATNTSGMGDFLYKAALFKSSIQQVTGPWIYIDVLMGTGWFNSSGASGQVRNLQWFTGGTPAPGTTSTYKPGNTHGGAGGGFGGIGSIPVLFGGQYRQAPDVTATGGSGSGLLLASSVNASGAVTAINIISPGTGYSGSLPTINIDPTYQISQATLGTPVLIAGTNADGAYPLPAWLAPGIGDLNNTYRMLQPDLVHPSPLGVEYLSTRLALHIYEGVMAL
ncbi:MAG: SGNH/GDSL hydrolase family protein [Gammaproteobacteria bacterium]|nr:SGNH/GDSL hydrolase family protein [Gammaproteobacteria bacterium]